MQNLTIGQLAKQANVNLETIRYYERRGLIPEPPRSESGYRQYSADDLQRTQFRLSIRCMGRGPVSKCPILDELNNRRKDK